MDEQPIFCTVTEDDLPRLVSDDVRYVMLPSKKHIAQRYMVPVKPSPRREPREGHQAAG